MEYIEIRKNILHGLGKLQEKKVSYQDICNHINNQDYDFTVYKDFFTRFRINEHYYNKLGKREKLLAINTGIKNLLKQEENSEEQLERELRTLVENAATEEFNAYSKVNTLEEYDEDNLTRFYKKGDPAHLVIRHALNHKREYNWQLENEHYGSDAKILSLKVTSIFSNDAIIHTQEYWKLSWIDKDTKTLQYVYESLNPQTYLLSKNKFNKWLIKDNIYFSNQKKHRPELIDYDNLKNVLTMSLTKQTIALNKLLKGNKLFYALELLKRTNTKDNIKETIQELRNNYTSALTNLNTNKINPVLFDSECNEIKKRIIAIWENQEVHI